MSHEKNSKSIRLVVIGGGSAGIGVIASIQKRLDNVSVTLIEPREKHYYQPAWTLVGGGLYDIDKTQKNMQDVIPTGVEWVKDAVHHVSAETSTVETASGQTIPYDYLIIACGLTLRWDLIEGLQETLGKNLSLIHI